MVNGNRMGGKEEDAQKEKKEQKEKSQGKMGDIAPGR